MLRVIVYKGMKLQIRTRVRPILREHKIFIFGTSREFFVNQATLIGAIMLNCLRGLNLSDGSNGIN